MVAWYTTNASREQDVENYLLTETYYVDGVDRGRSDLYIMLKTLEQFAGAEDVLEQEVGAE